MTMLRRASPAILALLASLSLLVAPPTATDVRAATPDLTITSDARYVVQPAEGRVRVTLQLTLRNRLQDTATTRFYFDRAFLAVLPESSGYRVSWEGSGTPTVRATSRTKDYTILRIDLPRPIYGGKSATYTLRFDLVDRGGTATRDLRVGDSLVSFPVWAYASDDTPGSTVTVTFPAGFTVDVAGGSIPAPKQDAEGRTVFRSGTLPKPLTFFAFLVGDRPGAYSERTITPAVGDSTASITIRAWPDDPAWDKRIGRLMERGLPVLADGVGLPWPNSEPLTVQEAVSRSTRGYAGLFDPTRRLVEVAYYASDFVVLHEAAHAWFNGSLLADRWANEAFASYYALEAAAALKIKASGETLTPEMADDRIALNAWGGVGREPTGVEDYAYAAALELANEVAARAGADGLRAVWADAATGEPAYPATGTPLQAAPVAVLAPPPDWRGLLDLLEANTDATYDDLWRTWVARDEDLPLLDARAAARLRYDEVLTEAGEWQLPAPVRAAMRAWQFEDARALLDQAADILEQRAIVDGAADAAGLTPPDALRIAFEGADGFEDAVDEAAAEIETIARYREAVASRPGEIDEITALGLWNESPDADLARAAAAFASGDLSGSARVGRSCGRRVGGSHRTGARPSDQPDRPWRGGPARDHPGTAVAHRSAAAAGLPAGASARFLTARDRLRCGLATLAATLAAPIVATGAGSNAGRRPRHGPSPGVEGTDGPEARSTVARDPVGRFGGRLLRASGEHPRARGARSGRDDGGLHPSARGLVRDRRGQEPARSCAGLGRSVGDEPRSARRRRHHRAEGDRAADPGTVSRVRAV